MKFSNETVFRINLAWVASLKDLKAVIKSIENDIYLDLPIGRTKPPNNSYSLDDLKEIIDKNSKIKYLAISNVESSNDISKYNKILGNSLTIVPKIESKKGVEKIKEISLEMRGKKTIMLDHDDLFSDLIKRGVPPSDFFTYISKLEDFCLTNSILLLKTRGVIFSDEDKYRY
tara:strand:+ start:102 stop:620 length:519 start_codon:yes stop_codon:yes gene_type:complete